ncbi:MAG: hypothetical protein WAW11_00875 [Patescibacteria group bacterium]
MENGIIMIAEGIIIIALVIFHRNQDKFNKAKLGLLFKLTSPEQSTRFYSLDIERLQKEKFNVINQLGGNLKWCLKERINDWSLFNLGRYDLDIDQIKNEKKRQIIKFWFIDALGDIPAKKFAEIFTKNIEQNLRVDNSSYYKHIERGKELIFSAITGRGLASSFYSELSAGIELILKRPDLTEDEKIIISAELINAKKIVKP